MPNTEVKLSSAEDSWQDACENRTLLGSFFLFGKQKSEAKWCFTFLSLHHWDKKGIEQYSIPEGGQNL